MYLLCMSHVHAFFHAFVHLFTYSYYCEQCWSFSDCFFLSPLYLLVMLVVSMAHKCKSTPARNPLHSNASTSSDHAPLSLRFHNDDAHKAFMENFSRQGIHSERSFFLTPTFPLSFTVGNGSLFVMSPSLVPSC